jgi:hypothetical protein
MFLKKINNFWNSLEKKYPKPTYIKKINILEFSVLKKALDEENISFIEKIIENLYLNQEAYILKRAVSNKLRDVCIALANSYNKEQKSNFFKMLDGCPNFHRIIDPEIAIKYSIYAIKHSFYFYNWNIKSNNEKFLKKEVYSNWSYIKYLSGLKKNEYENNIPSNLIVDRLQVVNYPSGGGELRDHTDPIKNIRVVNGIILSKIGKDFDEGGFYFRDKNNEKKNIEMDLDVGDSVSFYGSIVHGVDKIDPASNLNWSLEKGRWFLGMYSNESDHVQNRVTAKDLSQSIALK